MQGFGLSSAHMRSASVFALAVGLMMPGTALAQAQADPQQGTPAANTAPVVTGTPEQGATATNAVPEGSAATPGVDTAAANNEIVVTGVRASLERSIAIKRTSTGIVDAISAEDIGKFPDTNLAESLQRITGVSIDRVNGEGAQVTVRGFGPSFNLVTLNGRTLASSYDQTVGGDESGDGSVGVTRSFDFSNLASEGVKTLEVYKTSRAAVPSGGIGASINVVTRRPLDTNQTGLNGSIGAKAVYDTSANDCEKCGSKVTPQATGYLSWSNPEQTFGVAVFGAYQERHFSTVAATSQEWNIRTYSDFINPANGFINSATKINNAPTDGNELVAVPNDSRIHFSDDKYRRINAQGVVQWKPVDTLTLTADTLFARTLQHEQRSDISNWFNRPFDEVTFDGNPTVATTTYLHETVNQKDEDWEQQLRGQKNTLQDFGLNAKWEATSNLTFTADGHYSKSSVRPDNPNGTSSTLIGLAADDVTSHSVDYSGGIPVMHIVFSDSKPGGNGNGDGVLDVQDVSSTVGRTFTTSQRQTIKEGRADGDWDLGGGSHFNFGADYRESNTSQSLSSTTQTLGDWSASQPNDVNTLAPGALSTFCLPCKFNHYNPQSTDIDNIAFRGNAITLLDALSPYYAGLDAAGVTTHQISSSTSTNNVREKIFSAYSQVTWKGQLAGLDAGLVAGARYERTTVQSVSFEAVPTSIVWQSDNDFKIFYSAEPQPVTGKGRYDNLLPSFDFQVNFTPTLLGRFSASRSIARPDYNNLFAQTTAGSPSRPTALGGIALGSTGNPNLRPLISDNFDVSLEWYFKKDSYLSAGFFDKRVHNFIGTGTTTGTLFGLRDAASGQDGTRSGVASTQLKALGADATDVNLFTYTALLQQNGGSTAAATQQFQANYNNTTRQLNQDFVNQILTAVDISPDATDPLYNYSITQPVNNRDAQILGVEVAGQYFLGNTGFGVAASFTYVHGNVKFDIGGDPSVDQFALTGLSNTANATLIYDKNGISARLAYNWRDKFLSGLNRGGFRNPVFVAPYGQVDLNVSYDVTPHLALSIEGINLNNESVRTYARTTHEVWNAQEFQRRFLFGARYRF